MTNGSEASMDDKNDIMRTLRLDEQGNIVDVGSSSVIGRRSYQQDAIRCDDYSEYLEKGRLIAVLCDGMGGLSGGEKASALCSSMVFDTFHSEERFPSAAAFFKTVIDRADDGVRKIKADGGGTLKGSGTTLAAVIIEDGQLFWASVGDSRIYVLRGREMLCVTRDHNYLMLLEERVKRGEITREQADSDPRKEALVSYIGMGGVKYVDLNTRPLPLEDGDIILICSDGLYRTVTKDEMYAILTAHAEDVELAASTLTEFALGKQKRNQDNTSAIVIRYSV